VKNATATAKSNSSNSHQKRKGSDSKPKAHWQRRFRYFYMNPHSDYYVAISCGRNRFLANKKGEKYTCEDCGLVVLIEEPCGCEPCEIVCCGEPMKPVKEAEKIKIKKTSAPKPNPKK